MSTRRTIRRTAAALAAFGVAGGLTMGVAAAAPPEKVWVCHGTASATNPYVAVNVSANGVDPNGHIYGDPGHGWKNNPDQQLSPAPDQKAGPLGEAGCEAPSS